MEFHPDKNRDKRFSAGNAFKRIREAYDVLSDPKTKKMYDDHGKLKDSYNIFVEENKDVLEENVLEDAFNQLIKGKYPS
jgi:DnaJ-class molecular chaperone